MSRIIYRESNLRSLLQYKEIKSADIPRSSLVPRLFIDAVASTFSLAPLSSLFVCAQIPYRAIAMTSYKLRNFNERKMSDV